MEMAQLDGTTVHTCWNHSGLRMAVALSDGTLQLWDASTHSQQLTCTAHWNAGVGGRCPRVVWAPAECGDVVASCSADGGICVWEEVAADGESETTWRLSASLGNLHSAVLDMQFGNSSHGIKLLVVSADGHARIYQMLNNLNLKQWQLQAELQNARSLVETSTKHRFVGASVCWRSEASGNQPPAFVLGCNSTSAELNIAKVWEFEQLHQRWFCVAELREEGEEDKPVNHVSWAPNIGRPYEVIAVASGDGISIWHVNFMPTTLEKYPVQQIARLTGFEKEVWQVEWDMSGMTLASSGSDNIVRLWQANLKGEWHQSAQI